MSISTKLQSIANNVPRVYDAGKSEAYGEIQDLNAELEQTLYGTDTGGKSFYDELWDNLQNFGTKTNYAGFFRATAFEFIRPKWKVCPSSSDGAHQMFFACPNLRKIEAEYFDLSGIPDTSAHGIYYTFASCYVLEEIEDIGIQPSKKYDYAFAYNYALHTIAKIRPDENTTFTNTFVGCESLKNLTVDGVIGNAINFKSCTKLSHESLMSIINALKDFGGTTTWKTITLGSDNIAKLTAEELEIMDNKQWNYS